MTRREAREILRDNKKTKGFDFYMLEVIDDWFACTALNPDNDKCYYVTFNPVDGIELEYAGMYDDLI
ncbi:MAG: hypothetical protein PHW40_07540 [Candidatus Izemoplasmatales bacterium]|nr:hypothetical protein [Candidatus Izemoplasmatales bacterium]